MIWMNLSGVMLGDSPPPVRSYFRRPCFRKLYVSTRTVTTYHSSDGHDSTADTGWSDFTPLFGTNSGGFISQVYGGFLNWPLTNASSKNGSSIVSNVVSIQVAGLKMNWQIVNELTTVNTTGGVTSTTVALETLTITPGDDPQDFTYSYSGSNGYTTITNTMILIPAEGA